MGLQDCKLSWTPNKSTPESAISIMSCHNVHSCLTAGFTKVLCISHIFARRCKTSDLPGISYNMLQHGTACHKLRARMSDDDRWCLPICIPFASHLYSHLSSPDSLQAAHPEAADKEGNTFQPSNLGHATRIRKDPGGFSGLCHGSHGNIPWKVVACPLSQDS